MHTAIYIYSAFFSFINKKTKHTAKLLCAKHYLIYKQKTKMQERLLKKEKKKEKNIAKQIDSIIGGRQNIRVGDCCTEWLRLMVDIVKKGSYLESSNSLTRCLASLSC